MSRWRSTLLIAGGLVLFAGGATAASSDPLWVEAAVNTRSVRLGEVFKLSLTAGARNALLFLPGRNVVLPGCRLRQYEEQDVSRRHEGYRARQAVYTLAAFDLDQVIIPSLPVRVQWAEGNTATGFSLPIALEVRSQHPEEGLSLIDPKPPLPPALAWGLLALGLLVLGAGAGMAWQRRPAGTGRRQRPAHLIAYHRLELLARSRIAREAMSELFYIELSRITREYCSERYHFPALERPRRSILAELEHRGVSAMARQLLDSVLEEADLIKFAREPNPGAGRITAAHQRALAFVSATREYPGTRARSKA